MQCPICSALLCEHIRECETEAAATLQQRAVNGLANAGSAPQDSLNDLILESRKRQAYITHEMRGHREIAHPDAASREPLLRKKASA